MNFLHESLMNLISIIYNMSGRVVSDIQTRSEAEKLIDQYNSDANITLLNTCDSRNL